MMNSCKARITVLLLAVTTLKYADGSDDTYDYDDVSMFQSSKKSQWLSSSKSIAIEYHGCAWDYAADTDDAGCLEASSQDGKTSWYLMSNCRRTQAVYSVYSDSDSSIVSCSKKTYKGTFVTKIGIYGFMSYLAGYDEYPLITGDDDAYDEENLPMCEEDQNGYYVSVGCSASGELTIDRYTDKYCLQVKDTYKSLDSITSKLTSHNSCHQTYSSYNGNSPEYSLVGYLLPYSESCNQLDSPYCFDIDGSKSSVLKRTSNGSFNQYKHYEGISWATRLKYGLGTFFLASSFIMFVGILFTNRRKRRAMLAREFKRRHMERRRRSKSRGGSRGATGGDKSRPSSRGKGRQNRSRSRGAGSENEEDVGGTFV